MTRPPMGTAAHTLESISRSNTATRLAALCGIVAALAVCALAAVSAGGAYLGFGEIAHALLHPGSSSSAARIIWDIRLPRVLLGIVTGAALASSGCVFQSLLMNPLADPYTLGIAGGAALGAALAVVTGASAVWPPALPLCAFAGATISVALVYALSLRRGFSGHSVILGGVMLGYVCSAAVLLLYAFSRPDRVQPIMAWLAGDLSSAEMGVSLWSAGGVAAAIAVMWLYGRDITIICLGSTRAQGLGIDASRVAQHVFLAASLATGISVAAGGVIGFVGLIIPHAVRPLVGPDHRFLIPASAAAGGALLVLSDALARTVAAPLEIPVGVITGMCGGIFFLIFALRRSRA